MQVDDSAVIDALVERVLAQTIELETFRLLVCYMAANCSIDEMNADCVELLNTTLRDWGC